MLRESPLNCNYFHLQSAEYWYYWTARIFLSIKLIQLWCMIFKINFLHNYWYIFPRYFVQKYYITIPYRVRGPFIPCVTPTCPKQTQELPQERGLWQNMNERLLTLHSSMLQDESLRLDRTINRVASLIPHDFISCID